MSKNEKSAAEMTETAGEMTETAAHSSPATRHDDAQITTSGQTGKPVLQEGTGPVADLHSPNLDASSSQAVVSAAAASKTSSEQQPNMTESTIFIVMGASVRVR